MTTSDTVLYEVSDGVATVTLNRPDAMNALNTELKTALRDTLLAAAADDEVRAVLLTGNGRAFCVGQDLAEHAQNLAGDLSAVWATVPEHYTPIATTLATMAKPVVALVWRAHLSMRTAFKIQSFVMKLSGRELLPAKGGVNFPLGKEEMRWHLNYFNIAA